MCTPVPFRSFGKERDVGPQTIAATFCRIERDAERADEPGEAEAVEGEHRPHGDDVGDDAGEAGCGDAAGDREHGEPTPVRAIAAATITPTISSWPSAKLITRVT